MDRATSARRAAINADFKRRLAEKDVQALCDALVRQLGGEVTCFSQPRATMQTEGIPDRRYTIYGSAFWWEVKAEDGQLTADQHDFLQREHLSQSLGGCGTLEDLRDFLVSVRAGQVVALLAGRTLLARWATRGFRKSTTRRRGKQ